MASVLDYLENVKTKYPDKVAIADREKKYTFAQVEEKSKNLAMCINCDYFKKPVAVFASRNADVFIFYMATAYSGNFYVPIDPEMPKEKIKAVLEDCRPEYVFGNAEEKSIVDELGYECSFLTVDNKPAQIRVLSEVKEEMPLYMVYTSGSTGKPKGVLKSHKAVINYIEAYCETFDFSSNDVIGNQTPFFFDASAKDIYLMLKTGATLEIIPTEMFAMPTDLIDYMNDKGVTFISWVPTALSIIAQLNILSFVKPKYLKKVFFVGEVMPMKHLNKWRKALPDLQYVNLYGQSELAGICCYYEVKGEFENTDILPMGKPLSSCKIYLLDNDTIISEPNQIGEMYIVSDSLAIEYYNDSEKTANSFIVKDFGSGKVRCFKTGDLASYDNEGSLVFASRSDFQIKHMGHRIELGEIEVIAGALPEVQRCCCLYNQEKKKIVLFCELSQGVELNGQQIQSILRGKLSTYMVPSKVVIMDKLPINANGKINRQELKNQL